MEMKLFGDDLRVEVDIWELFQFHDRRDRIRSCQVFYDLCVFLSDLKDISIAILILLMGIQTQCCFKIVIEILLKIVLGEIVLGSYFGSHSKNREIIVKRHFDERSFLMIVDDHITIFRL